MNASQLLAHFDHISDASDAIPHLRRFILDITVRGKLVEQDPKDEPATELLKRIKVEKSQLIESGKIRKEHQQPAIEPKEIPFALPKRWAWARLGDVIHLVSGQHLQPSEYSDQQQSGPPYITGPADFGEKGLVITRYAVVRKAVAENGQILLTVKGAGVGKTAICDRPEVAISRQLMALTAIGWSQQFLLLTTHRLANALKGSMRSLIPGISRVDVEQFVFPLPPLVEQHRIVAKVDELMKLCDLLETAQMERESRRDRLVASSLQRLNQPADESKFREYARFYFSQLPRLTTRPEHIQQLRQTILNLAIHGKLVPQDPTDEPASVLFKRIQMEKNRLIQQSEARERRSSQENEDFGESFKIPQNWRWVRLREIAFEFRYGTSVKCSYESAGEPVLRIPNINNGRINTDGLKYGPLSLHEADNLRLQLGDILIIRSNGSLNLVGRPALVEEHVVGYCYAGYLVRVRTSTIHLDGHYLLLSLNTSHVRDQIEIPIRTTVGLKNVNTTELSGLTIPLPPLTEQHRIVAKVNELMELCNQLETQLITTNTESSRLLEALLHEALAPAV